MIYVCYLFTRTTLSSVDCNGLSALAAALGSWTSRLVAFFTAVNFVFIFQLRFQNFVVVLDDVSS